jgi:uncharacterized protein YqiB (DUF1249 family)
VSETALAWVNPLRPRKASYTVNLVDLHSLCESNYARVLRLFPDYEQRNDREIVAGQSRLTLNVTERCRYTTNIRLTHVSPLGSHWGGIDLDIRLYHDARMAEVVGFQSHSRLAGRYQYPNTKMYQRDEKQQQNQYVADLLAFCMREGVAPDCSQLNGLLARSERSVTGERKSVDPKRKPAGRER